MAKCPQQFKDDLGEDAQQVWDFAEKHCAENRKRRDTAEWTRAYVVACEGRRRGFFQVCRHKGLGGANPHWLSPRGWLPARLENVRHYSRFKTDANARKAMAKAEGASEA